MGQGKEEINKDFLLSQKIVNKALEEIWDFLLPSEQTYLENLIKGKKDENLFLEQIGLVKMGKIAIPLFEEYIKKIEKIENATKETIVYDSSTNNITLGNDDISERLTGLEFRLLRFLVENEGKLIERDQIINEVWRDNESVEGVTEAALDQLIFRLRKKIEENPNKPEHIETIKGRGVRFRK